MQLFLDTWHLFAKYTRITIRTPMWAVFTIIQPLIWLIIFGQLFKNMSNLPGFGYDSYLDFFVPGVLIMTVLFGSSWSGINLLREINFGVIEKMFVTPIYRIAIVLSRILHAAVQVVIQCFIIMLIALLIGTKIEISFLSLCLCALIVFLLGVGFAALSNAFAIMLKREEPLVVIGNYMTLPLMFFSSALIPTNFMPGWIKVLSMLNPVDYAVKAVRMSIIGGWNLKLFIIQLIFVSIFAAFSLFIANTLFINSEEREK